MQQSTINVWRWCRLTTRVALADLRHEIGLSTALVVSIATLLLPILIFQGIRQELIGNLLTELTSDPRSRELQPLGQGSFDRKFFDELKQHSGVAFVIPTTRYLAASVELENSNSVDGKKVFAAMLPTAQGDPILGGAADIPKQASQIVIAMPVAEALQVSVGDELIGSLTRNLGTDSYEKLEKQLTIIGVLPASTIEDRVALVSPVFLEASEDFRENFKSDFFGTDGRERDSGDRIYPSFRLYATTVFEVEAVREWLVARDVEVSTQLGKIKLLQRLDLALRSAVVLLAITIGAGIAISLSSSFWINVKRKNQQLSTLAALGFSPNALIGIPMIQGFVLGALGALVASCIYAIGIGVLSRFIQNNFSDSGLIDGMSLVFHWSDAMVLLGTAILVAVLSSSGAAWRLSQVEPGLGMRSE